MWCHKFNMYHYCMCYLTVTATHIVMVTIYPYSEWWLTSANCGYLCSETTLLYSVDDFFFFFDFSLANSFLWQVRRYADSGHTIYTAPRGESLNNLELITNTTEVAMNVDTHCQLIQPLQFKQPQTLIVKLMFIPKNWLWQCQHQSLHTYLWNSWSVVNRLNNFYSFVCSSKLDTIVLIETWL